MTIVSEETINATDVLAWCEKVSALYAEHGSPITSADDPRAADLLKVDPGSAYVLQHDPRQAGLNYFTEFAEIPPAPLPTPHWSCDQRVSPEMWPKVVVTFSSQHVRVGTSEAWAEQMFDIQVEDGRYRSGRIEAGTITSMGKPAVTLSVDDELVDFYDAEVAELKKAAAALLKVAVMIDAPAASASPGPAMYVLKGVMRPCERTECIDTEHAWLGGEFNDAHRLDPITSPDGVYTLYAFHHEDQDEDHDGWHVSATLHRDCEDQMTLANVQALAADFATLQARCDELNRAEVSN